MFGEGEIPETREAPQTSNNKDAILINPAAGQSSGQLFPIANYSIRDLYQAGTG